MNTPYRFRNLPCVNSAGVTAPYCISGCEVGLSYGVLEWCKDFRDAKEVLSEMLKDNRFVLLEILKHNEETDKYEVM